jgi:hypothetical protein
MFPESKIFIRSQIPWCSPSKTFGSPKKPLLFMFSSSRKVSPQFLSPPPCLLIYCVNISTQDGRSARGANYVVNSGKSLRGLSICVCVCVYVLCRKSLTPAPLCFRVARPERRLVRSAGGAGANQAREQSSAADMQTERPKRALHRPQVDRPARRDRQVGQVSVLRVAGQIAHGPPRPRD